MTVDGVSAPLGGDAIVAFDGKPMRTAAQLADAVALHKPGDVVKLTVVRGGARRDGRGHARRHAGELVRSRSRADDPRVARTQTAAGAS